MEQHSILVYILLAIVVTNLIRVVPMAFIKGPISNRFVRSFLYYVPYVTLAVMTFPAIIEAAGNPLAGAAALAVGILLSWLGAGLFPVAVCCCISVFAVQFIMTLL